MFEDFINAIQNFKRNKTRTLLSLLGVIIGVASVIVITSLGKSSTQQIQGTFGSAGLDVVNVRGGFMRRQRDSVSLNFDEPFRTQLYDNVKNIKQIWYKNSLNATLSYGETSVSTDCAAIETDYLNIYNMKLEDGTFFSVTDNQEGVQKIILNKEIATALFPAGNGIGKVILLTTNNVSFSFEVIGILKEQNTGIESSATYIPRGFYAKKIQPNPTAANIMVQAVSSDKAPTVATDITEYCKELTGTEYSVNVVSMQSMIDQVNEISNTMNMMLSAIAAISLLVGGIGIMNIMIVTVTERKQEIGIRKALGASPNDIRRQFLVESASITLIGGFCGIILGILLSFAIEYVRSFAFTLNGKACIIAFVFSVFIGIFFGLSPAAKAAKLDPVIALSGE